MARLGGSNPDRRQAARRPSSDSGPGSAVVRLLASALFLVSATGAAACEPEHVFNLRLDNDLFGGRGQDQGYSNGFLASWRSPDLDAEATDCLPASLRWAMTHIDWLPPEAGARRNLVFSIGHALFTPENTLTTQFLPDDRPYAAALIFGVGANTRRGDRLRTTQLRLGIVGPSARGEQVQNGWHAIIGSDRARGWEHQLGDEPVFQLLHERSRRVVQRSQRTLGWDAIVHWGVSVGNLSTHTNTGVEWRFGKQLPDDFGSDPQRPAGENLAPGRAQRRGRGWSWHVFATLDVRGVAYNIALDGNAWKDSHQVDKRPWVADAGIGLALTRGAWKFTIARFERSREFDGQSSRPAYGSITLSRAY